MKTEKFRIMKSKIYKMMCVACVATALSSCLDTIILPDDVTVGEDFWKKKSDVALMVNAAYQGMTTEGVIERLIVWGDYRSDEFVQTSLEGALPNDLAELAAASTQVKNRYTIWSEFYSVINKCNIVLEKAGGVLDEDPNYTEGDYLTDCSQMLALRSLCYFYLVRTFRDIPYVDGAYTESSQERVFVQFAPAEVLQRCIESLQEAESNAINATSYARSDWRRVGWFTRDGIRALLADIYLWRASVMHNADDYQRAIDYCNMVIQSKKDQHVVTGPSTGTSEYPLTTGTRYYEDLFVTQNAEESLFELQVSSNTAVCKYFFMSSNTAENYVNASSIFEYTATISGATSGNKVFAENDMRLYNGLYFSKSNQQQESYGIRKMVDTRNKRSNTADGSKNASGRAYGGWDQNYIIYRLSDVMLMKAEALVQLAVADTDGFSDEEKDANEAKLKEAFELVQYVNDRSLVSTDGDRLSWDNLVSMKRNGKEGLELLVLEERLRELCFEGKRWYDLLRYNYRHVDGVNYNVVMGDLGFDGLPANYEEMLKLTTRNHITQQSGLVAKMRNEGYLYLPLPESDVILCPGLKQNPVYGKTANTK